MKKLLCIILALIMVVSLISCGAEPAQEEMEISADTPADVVADAEETVDEEETYVDPATIWNGTLIHGGEGFYNPEYDYFSNPRYKICYFAPDSYSYEIISRAIEHWCSVMNLEYGGIIVQKDHLGEAELQLLALTEQYDGIILGDDFEGRFAAVLKEADCPWIYWDIRRGERNGPSVTLSVTDAGAEVAEYIAQYFKENMTDIPVAEIGVLYSTYSGIAEIENREVQFSNTLNNLVPELGANIVLLNHNVPYDLLNFDYYYDTVLQENPQYKYWICVPMSDIDTKDAVAAFDRNGFGERSYIFSTADAEEVWVNNDYSSCVAVYMNLPAIIQTEPFIGALYGFMTGELEPDSIWGGGEGGFGSVELGEPFWVTRDNYKDYLGKVNEYVDGEFYTID